MNKISISKTSKLFIAATVSCLLFSSAARADINIGAILPLTGALQAYGGTLVKGIKLAVDQVKLASGGIDGKNTPVHLKVMDTQSETQPSISAAQRMVLTENVKGIIGPMSSPNIIAVATSVLPKNDVIIITPTATSPLITTLKDRGFLFRNVLSDAYQGVALSELANLKKFHKVAVLYVNNEYGKGLNATFTKAFTKQGGVILGDAAYSPNKQTYRADLQALTAHGKADALLVIGYPDDGGLTILKESIQNQFFTKFLASDGMFTPNLIKNLGTQYLNNRIFGTAPASSGLNKGAIRFNKLYTNFYKEAPDNVYVASAYDDAAIMLLATAKAAYDHKTNNPTPAQIRDEIYHVTGKREHAAEIYPDDLKEGIELINKGKPVTYKGTLKNMAFDKNGDLVGSIHDFEIWSVSDNRMTFENFPKK